MVDFDNETTITTPATDIIKVIYLERRKFLIDAIEHYYKQRKQKINANTGIIASRLIALFVELYHSLKRYYSDQDFEQLQQYVYSDNWNDLYQGIVMISRWFDDKRLTMIDTIKRYDTTMVEKENEEKGL